MNNNLESLLTGVQGKTQGAMESAVKQVAAQKGMGVRGAQGYNAAVHAGLNVISNEIKEVLLEMKKFQPNQRQWEHIRERCKSFVDIQHKEVFRLAAERTFFTNAPSPDNNHLNLWLENTLGSVNNFIDAEIASATKIKNNKWEERFWDITKIGIGGILGYIVGKFTS